MSRRTCAASTSASASSRSASSVAASWYSGIANGVGGAPAFLSGLVAIHASKAGLNSARNRVAVEARQLGVPARVRVDPLHEGRDVDLASGRRRAPTRAPRRSAVLFTRARRLRLLAVPAVRLVAAPGRGHRGEREQEHRARCSTQSRRCAHLARGDPGVVTGTRPPCGPTAVERLVDDVQRALHRDGLEPADVAVERVVEELEQEQHGHDHRDDRSHQQRLDHGALAAVREEEHEDEDDARR